MLGTAKLGRWVAPLAAATALAGGALFVGGATVLAWDKSPQVTTTCAPSTTTYGWHVSFNESGMPDYNIDWYASNSKTLPKSPTWTEFKSSSWPFNFTTPQSSGEYLWAQWVDDTGAGVFGPVTANANLCTPVTPSISTQLTSSVISVGTGEAQGSDSATLSNGYQPTGSITFYTYTQTGCAGTATSQGSVSVNSGNGTYDSKTVTFTQAQTYYWQAKYSGDANNNSVTSGCNAEPLTVTPDGPSITTHLPATGILVGKSVKDTATLTGATSTASGKVTFTIYTNGGSAGCSMAATTGTGNDLNQQGGNASVSGDGTYSSATVTFNKVGTYYWQAVYSGNSNNLSVKSTCGSETVTVTNAPTPTPNPTPTPKSTPTPTSTSTPTPTGSVLGITVPNTGTGSTSRVTVLGLVLLVLGSTGLIAQTAIRRRTRGGKIEIENI